MLFKHPTLNYYEITFAWTTQTAEIARDEQGRYFVCFIDTPKPEGLGLRESGPHATFRDAYKLVAQYFILHRKMTCRAPDHVQTTQEDPNTFPSRTGKHANTHSSSDNRNPSRDPYDGDLLQAV